MNAAARFDESASATGSSMRPRGLFDGPFRAGPAQARPARAGRVRGTTGRDSRHGPALSSGRASPALMISCWAVFWAPVFGPCSGWPSWARPIFPALPPPVRPSSTPWRAGGTAARRRPAPCPGPWVMRGGAVVSSLPCVTAYSACGTPPQPQLQFASTALVPSSLRLAHFFSS